MKNSNNLFLFLFLFLLLALCTTGAYFKFHKNHEDIPIGCDEFGYMSLAKAFDEGTTYQEHVKRPYLPALLDTLRHQGITEREIQWLVVPHAYYVVPGTNQIINQYPPGTSWVLSWIPLAFRQVSFPGIAMFLFLLFPSLALFLTHKEPWPGALLILMIFTFYATLSTPILNEFTRINSLAFTFGLLIAAGILLKNKPLLSCLLIALSANFRLVNVLLLLPLLFFVPAQLKITRQNILLWFKLGWKYLLIITLALSPYIIYMYRLRGNPLLPTYASNDTALNTNVLSNIRFYFDPLEGLFQLHLIAIALLFVLFLYNKISIKAFFSLLAFPLLNYLFFIFHQVQMNYYPYASFFILFGFLLNHFDLKSWTYNRPKTAKLFCLVLALAILTDGIISYHSQSHKTFETAQNEYKALCSYQIVWGELLPSASEYVCKNNGFKFSTSTSRARKITMQFLFQKHYPQLFILKDIPDNGMMVKEEIKQAGLPFQQISDKNFGDLLIIR